VDGSNMVDKQTVRDGYDVAAEAYVRERSFDEPEQQLFERFLDSLVADPLVLDAGCGAGMPILERLVDRFDEHSTIGLDFSSRQLALAKERFGATPLVAGDMAQLPIAESTLDAVVAFYSLIHLPESQHQQALAEFSRVLRPGGRLLVSEGTDQWEGRNDDWLAAGAEMEWHIAGATATREHLRTTGFHIERELEVSDVLVDGESWVFFEALNR